MKVCLRSVWSLIDYLHWLVKALGKEHGNAPYALDYMETQGERLVLNENLDTTLVMMKLWFERVSHRQPASASQSPQTARSLCCPRWTVLQSSHRHQKLETADLSLWDTHTGLSQFAQDQTKGTVGEKVTMGMPHCPDNVPEKLFSPMRRWVTLRFPRIMMNLASSVPHCSSPAAYRS